MILRCQVTSTTYSQIVLCNTTDEENLANPMFRAAFRSAVEKEFPLKFEVLKNEYETKIKGLEREIRRL